MSKNIAELRNKIGKSAAQATIQGIKITEEKLQVLDKLRLTPEQLARIWKTTVGTLAVWRSQGKGPIYIKIGEKVMYMLEDIMAFEEKNKNYPKSSCAKE